ncbi:MAG: fibronectin type III domain-containing protein [Candidatus Kaiserbacteria bacterium]|nr:fibronectin type III domain-containing protein [Candidatus Kaiserbacteria bacterium]
MFPLKNVARGIAPAVIISGIAATTVVGVGSWFLFSGDDVPGPLEVGEKTDSADIIGGSDRVGEESSDLLLQGISDDDQGVLTLYEVLGVDRGASEGEIREACDRQSNLYRDVPELLALIRQACFLLLDQDQRRIYDNLLSGDEGYFDVLGLERDATQEEIENAFSLASRRFSSAFDTLGLPGIVAYADGTSVYLMTRGGFSGKVSPADFQFSDPSVQVTHAQLSDGVIVLTVAQPITDDRLSLEYDGSTLFFRDGVRVSPFAVFVQRDNNIPSITFPHFEKTDTPPSTPQNFRVVSRGSGYIDLAWDIPTGINPDNISYYHIQVFRGDSCAGTPERELRVAGDETATRVTGIEEDVSYSFRIRVVTNDGASVFSECLSGDGPLPGQDPRAPGTPENFRFDGFGMGFIKVVWDPVEDNGFGIEYYDIIQYRGIDCTDRVATYRVDADETEKIISGTMDTEYSFQIRSGNYFGVSELSDCISVKTENDSDTPPSDPGSPGTPNLQVQLTSSFFVALRWNRPESATPIIRYELRQHNGNECQGQPYERFIEPEDTAVRVSARPETDYSFRIRARNAAGASEYSPCLSTTTRVSDDDTDDSSGDTFGPLIPPLPRFLFAFTSPTFNFNNPNFRFTNPGFDPTNPEFNFIPPGFDPVDPEFSFVPPELDLTNSNFRFVTPEFDFTVPEFTFPPLPNFFFLFRSFRNAFESYTILSDPGTRREYINLLIATDSGDGIDPDDISDDGGDGETEIDFDGDREPDETSLFFRGPGDDTTIPEVPEDDDRDEGEDDGGDEPSPRDPTRSGRPGAPENVRDESEGARISLVWDAPDSNGSPVRGYEVFQFRGGSCGVTFTNQRIYSTTSTQRVLPGDLNGTYSFRVRARNDIGFGDLSDCFAITLTASGQVFDPATPPVIDFGTDTPPVEPLDCIDPVSFIVREGGVSQNAVTLSVIEDSICYSSRSGDYQVQQFTVVPYLGRGCVAGQKQRERRFLNPGDVRDDNQYFTINAPFYDMVVGGLTSNQTYSFKVVFSLLFSDGTVSDADDSTGHGCLEVTTLPETGEYSSVYTGEYGAAAPYLSEGGGDIDVDSFFEQAVTGVFATILGSFVACGVNSLIAIGGSVLGTKIDTGLRIDPVQAVKECMLDPIAKEIAFDIAAKMAADYSEYALSGFNGKNPFFTNKERYLKDLLDDATGRIIDRNNLGFLCDVNGFNIDISQHLYLKYRNIKRRPPRCTGSQALKNVTGIYNKVEGFIEDPTDVLKKTEILSVGLVRERDLYITDPGSTYTIDLEKARREAIAFVEAVSPVSSDSASVVTVDDLAAGDWSVFISRKAVRDEPNLAWNPSQGNRLSYSLDEIENQLPQWAADTTIHSVVAERPLYNLENSSTGFAVVLRLYLKHHVGGRTLADPSIADKLRGVSGWGCQRIEDCLTAFDSSRWCATVAVGDALSGSEVLSTDSREWSHRFNPEQGSHASVLLEKEVGFSAVEVGGGSDPDHFTSLCRRSPIPIDGMYVQTVLRITPPVFRISRDARDDYGFDRRGRTAYFDLSSHLGFPGERRRDRSTEKAEEEAVSEAVKGANAPTVASVEGMLEDEVRDAKEELDEKVGKGNDDNTVNIWKECEEENNVEDKELCIEKLANADDINEQIRRNDNRNLDGVNQIDEFGELFSAIFKNTIVGLVKKVQNGLGEYNSMVGIHHATRSELRDAGYVASLRNFAGINDELFTPEQVSTSKDTFLSPYYQLAKAQIVVRDAYLILQYLDDNIIADNTQIQTNRSAFDWFNPRDPRQIGDLKIKLGTGGSGSLHAFISTVKGVDVANDRSIGSASGLDQFIRNSIINGWRLRQRGDQTEYVWYDDVREGSFAGSAERRYLRSLRSRINAYRRMYEDTVKFHLHVAENHDLSILGDYDNKLAGDCSKVFEDDQEICRDGFDESVSATAYRLLETGEAPVLVSEGNRGYTRYLVPGHGCDVPAAGGERYTFSTQGSVLRYTSIGCTVKEFGEYIDRVLVQTALDIKNLVRFLYSSTENPKIVELPATDSSSEQKRIEDIFTIVPPPAVGTEGTSVSFYLGNKFDELVGDHEAAAAKYEKYRKDKEEFQYYRNAAILRNCVEEMQKQRTVAKVTEECNHEYRP